jgi:pyroglutamyl-peptidase
MAHSLQKEEQLPDETARSFPRFIVTGFGPFGGVKDNPTTVIVRKLQGYLEQSSATHLAALLDDCILLETSAQDVNRTCDRLEAELAKVDGGHENKRILLHLGVDESSSMFKLESCAYNEATFRIPDQQGYQPLNVSIFDEEEYQCCLRTSLKLEGVADSMTQRFPNITTKISTDPGRYVCNFVYCTSLQRFEKANTGICSLFLHVPPFSKVPEEQQLDYIAGLLEALAEAHKA